MNFLYILVLTIDGLIDPKIESVENLNTFLLPYMFILQNKLPWYDSSWPGMQGRRIRGMAGSTGKRRVLHIHY